jgi:hypothetical protein
MAFITADRGILNANKPDNLLILLRGQFAERLGKSKSIRKLALVRPKEKFWRCTANVPGIGPKSIKSLYQSSPAETARRPFVRSENPASHAARTRRTGGR